MESETKLELEQWLRTQAAERVKTAESRRGCARAYLNPSESDRKISHSLAEKMIGRKLRKTTKSEDADSARMQESIADKLDKEAAQLMRFADLVSAAPSSQAAQRLATALEANASASLPDGSLCFCNTPPHHQQLHHESWCTQARAALKAWEATK